MVVELSSISIELDQLLNTPKQALLPIIQRIPGWEGAHTDHIGVQQLSGAMTNLVYKVEWHPQGQPVGAADVHPLTPGPPDAHLAIVRVFGGSDGLFDRESERSISRIMSEMDLGPALLVRIATHNAW